MNRIVIAAIAAIAIVCATCGQTADEPVKAPEGMSALDLSRYGKPFVLFVPDTASAPVNVTEDPSGALLVTSGTRFAMSIRESAEDLTLRKRDITDDEVNKLKQFLVEDSVALVWESAITTSEHHFVMNGRAGDGVYAFEDLRGNAVPLSKDAVMAMYESVKAIKTVKRDPA
jgi:hypothetical protein